jgi:hypothetical protein
MSLQHEEVEVKLVDEKILQEEVTEASELSATVENPQIMEVKEDDQEEMVYPKEDKDEMVYPKEDDEDKEMEEHDDEDEEMGGHDDEEDMVKEDKEKEEMVEEEDQEGTNDEEGEEIEEENMTKQETQIGDQKEASSTALDYSERAELEAFRRERKEGLISSFEDDLSTEFLDKLKTEIDQFSIDELEVILSKEYTRVNRVTKASKPNAFIYNPDSNSKTKSEADIVKELVQKYK